MDRPKICLTLTGKTIDEDLRILDKYRKYVDIAELRADFLEQEERLKVREFPAKAHIPCILTVRRRIDGGQFVEGEASRTTLFARALAFADSDQSKNFDYVDFEEDFNVQSLIDAALAFGIKIIRSVHSMEEPVKNIASRLESLRSTGLEIPKIAFMPKTLKDVEDLFEEAKALNDNNHILIAMGPLGTVSRILSAKLKNYLTFVSAPENSENTKAIGQLDPVVMNDVYHFSSLDQSTKIYGITGWPLAVTSSPALHNEGYKLNKMNAVYVPLPAENFSEAFSFADAVGIEGMSVTVPHKEKVLECVENQSDKVTLIGASNTIVKKDGQWKCYNTDIGGFTKALQEFLGCKNLRGKKVAIIGAGGASAAIAASVKLLKGKACIFNRTVRKARLLAERFGFKYAALSSDSVKMLNKYSQIIIQTTSIGMNAKEPYSAKDDPLWFYDFNGKEKVFDIVYVPAETPVMKRARESGCLCCNGYNMLKYQGYEQFELFTGKPYEFYKGFFDDSVINTEDE